MNSRKIIDLNRIFQQKSRIEHENRILLTQIKENQDLDEEIFHWVDIEHVDMMDFSSSSVN